LFLEADVWKNQSLKEVMPLTRRLGDLIDFPRGASIVARLENPDQGGEQALVDQQECQGRKEKTGPGFSLPAYDLLCVLWMRQPLLL